MCIVLISVDGFTFSIFLSCLFSEIPQLPHYLKISFPSLNPTFPIPLSHLPFLFHHSLTSSISPSVGLFPLAYEHALPAEPKTTTPWANLPLFSFSKLIPSSKHVPRSLGSSSPMLFCSPPAFKDACFPWRSPVPGASRNASIFHTNERSLGTYVLTTYPLFPNPATDYNLEAVSLDEKRRVTLVFITAQELTWDNSPARHLKHHLLRAPLLQNPPRTSHFCCLQRAPSAPTLEQPPASTPTSRPSSVATVGTPLMTPSPPTHLSNQPRSYEMVQQ